MLFVEFMAEMRRPWDFWKGMISAQIFIFFFYMLFGLVSAKFASKRLSTQQDDQFIYSFQGQYTINPANQGLSPFAWQTVTNIISLIAAIIAAGLYGNIGIKVLYANVLQDIFNFPNLATKAGQYIWSVTVVVYWSLAFVVSQSRWNGSAIG